MLLSLIRYTSFCLCVCPRVSRSSSVFGTFSSLVHPLHSSAVFLLSSPVYLHHEHLPLPNLQTFLYFHTYLFINILLIGYNSFTHLKKKQPDIITQKQRKAHTRLHARLHLHICPHCHIVQTPCDCCSLILASLPLKVQG